MPANPRALPLSDLGAVWGPAVYRKHSRLALPQRCRICQRWPAQTLCADCLACFADHRLRCTRCAQLLPEASLLAQCLNCLRKPPMVDWVLARQGYDYPWSMLLTQLKFEGDIGLARALGQHLAATPGLASRLAQTDWVIPLPLAGPRLAERGYNQATLLARALLAELGTAYRRKLQAKLLSRPHDNHPQHGLTRSQRLSNMRHAYHVPDPARARLRGSRVLLVDDVMTTGASLEAAARALRQAGAQEVGALVLARA